MKTKLKLALAALVCSFATYGFANQVTSIKCDASNSNKCEISGVGTGTGQLIKDSDHN